MGVFYHATNVITPCPSTTGLPSGRAQLPLTLESADEMVQSLSPGHRPMADAELEELERDFFETVSRNTEV